MLQVEVATARSSGPPSPGAGASGAILSRRQQEVLELLASGIPAREIAARLGLAEATVRNHIRAILRKLGCHSQLEAVAVAYRTGLLGPPGAASTAVLPAGRHQDGPGREGTAGPQP